MGAISETPVVLDRFAQLSDPMQLDYSCSILLLLDHPSSQRWGESGEWEERIGQNFGSDKIRL